MLGFIGFCWRLFSFMLDIKAWKRRLLGQAVIDVCFVTNIRDETDKRRFLGKWKPSSGHFNGPMYYLNGVGGRTRAIYTLSEDLLSISGTHKAKENFIKATRWAQERGAKVILLAASTKRLFGESAHEIKTLFPDLLFTIGDNGTALLLLKETLNAINKAGLEKNCKIAIVGAYGFLGESIIKSLKRAGFNNLVGLGRRPGELKRVSRENNIPVFREFEDMVNSFGKVDVAITCTYKDTLGLISESIKMIKVPNKKLLIIDVSEPSNMSESEYDYCKNIIVRQDAGNAHSEKLKYVLGAITYKMFRLSRGVAFGCFAEALVLASAIKDGDVNIKELDWCRVEKENMDIVQNLFDKYDFEVPAPPLCFGKAVNSFNLNL